MIKLRREYYIYNIYYMRKAKDLTTEEIIDIIEKRKEGIKEIEIISHYNISRRQYSNILKLNNINKKHKNIKYNFNEDYFETIDTEDKAYFLGFIVADGCVSTLSNAIQITQKEPDILYLFKKYINYEGNLFKRSNRDCFDIKVSSHKMKKDLSNIGILPNKTMVIKYPIIPENLENHFMRGVFDGDGCISIHKDKRDNSERGQVNICSGSIDFISTYVDKLVEYCGVKRNKIRCPSGTYNVIDWGGLSDVEKLYSWFYKDATVFLERKKKTFDAVIDIHSNKTKYRKS